MIARDELAARVLVALLTRDGYDGDGAARDAVVAADALLSALAVPPAAPESRPSASTIDGAVDAYFAQTAKARTAAPAPAPYVPKVGDKIRHSDGRVVILTAPRANCHFGSWDSFVLVGDKRLECVPVPTDSSWWTYLGPATASERAAAGLPVDEATTPPACHGECGTEAPGRCSTGCAPDERPTTPPAATPAYPVDAAGRPLWVRITALNGDGGRYLTVGSVYRVNRWGCGGSPVVDPGCGYYYLCGSGDAKAEGNYGLATWEPCAAPTDAVTPAAALTEEERADLRDAIWKERTAWLATGADQRSEPDVYANAAAAWFAKRDGTVKP